MDSVDPLEFLPICQWYKLKEIFKFNWPRNVTGYNIIDTQEYIIKKGLDYGFKVYCPFGDVSNGMVAINTKNNYREINIQYPKDDTSILENALRNTKVIDWTNSFEVWWTPKYVMECVKRVAAEKGIKDINTTTSKTFILNKQTPFSVKLPEGISFEPLTTEHNLELIDSVWPHRYPSSVWYFELLTKANLGYGLFNNDELVSWVFIRESGALGHMYTLKKHRRNRYGELTVKMIANVLISQGKTVFAFSVLDNTVVHESLEKLGFEHVNDVENCTFKNSNSE